MIWKYFDDKYHRGSPKQAPKENFALPNSLDSSQVWSKLTRQFIYLHYITQTQEASLGGHKPARKQR